MKIFDVFPVTAFTAVQNSACQPEIQFNNFTGCAASYVWDFGTSGGKQFHRVNPMFSYDLPGTYLVTLSATEQIVAGPDKLQQVLEAGRRSIHCSLHHSLRYLQYHS
ncbi:MAG: PKD domain-containing protein [Bacteroidetes bacterium]|nr:PKD domain-containing protein [Bacteroidota bacterium]